MKIFLFFTIIGLILYFPIFYADFAGDDASHFYIVKKNYSHNVLTPFDRVIGTQSNNRLLGYFYRPLPFIIYSSFYYLGLPAFFYHLLQLFFYIAGTYLLYLFFSKFFSQRLSFLLSSIFLIHPANNDLAAYIAALDETLCLLFGLLVLLLIGPKRPSLLRLSTISAVMLFCFLSKETAVLFAAFGLFYIFSKKASWQYIIAILVSAGIYLLFRVHAAYQPVFLLLKGRAAHFSAVEHLFLALQIAFAFIKEIFIPTRSSIKPGVFDPTLRSSILPTIELLIFVLSCWALWIVLKSYSRKASSIFLFFLFWIALGITLHTQIIPLEVLFADRWLYITEIGLLGAIGTIFTTIPLKRNRWFVIGTVLVGILLFLYCLETFILNIKWHDWQRYFV